MASLYSPVRTGNQVVDRNLDAIRSAFSSVSVTYTTTLLTASNFLNGWKALTGVQAPGYRIWTTGEVEMFGGITGGTNSVAAFILPSSLAPAATRQWAVASWDGAPEVCLLKVDGLGNVIPVYVSNTQVFLDGVRFVSGA